jgi:hypothetical protein
MPRLRDSSVYPVVAGLLAAGSALLASWLLRSQDHGVAGRVALALLPAPFTALFIGAELRWIRRLDEFHRRVVLDSLAIAFPAALLLAVVVEGLQKAGFVTGWTLGDVWPWMALTWVPALWIAYRRYR